MEVLRVNGEADYGTVIERSLEVLRTGGTVVFPTDTLYALGCNALDSAALGKVFDIKRRVYTAAVPVLVRNALWARELIHLDEHGEKLMEAFWPGKVTIVAVRKQVVPAMATGGGQTLGVRAPGHPFAQQLLDAFGYPLCGTSANLSGQEPSADPARIIADFADEPRRPDVFIDAGVLPLSEPSTVVDLSGARPRIARQGAVRADKVLPLL